MNHRFFAPLIALMLLATGGRSAHADDVTSIQGEFNGCATDRAYQLQDGRLLVCRQSALASAFNPRVVIGRGYTAMIDGRTYRVSIEAGRVTRTLVAGNFAGCADGRVILLENGMSFACRSFAYGFGYRPQAEIVVRFNRTDLFIDGRKYDVVPGDGAPNRGATPQPRIGAALTAPSRESPSRNRPSGSW